MKRKPINEMNDEEILQEILNKSLDSDYKKEIKWQFSNKDNKPDLNEVTPENQDFLNAYDRYDNIRKNAMLKGMKK